MFWHNLSSSVFTTCFNIPLQCKPTVKLIFSWGMSFYHVKLLKSFILKNYRHGMTFYRYGFFLDTIHNKDSLRHCHYYDNGKSCPFEEVGCMFLQKDSAPCKFGIMCKNNLCHYKHDVQNNQTQLR